jgi:hypothetical protein
MTIDTNIIYTKENIGKNLYRKKTYYTLVVEQEVLAKDKDEADQKFLDDGGIDHSQINHEITETKNGVETYMVDANYSDSGKTEYIGKVVYEDDEFAKEDGLVEIDQYADENALTEKEESDVDIAIQLEAENQRGK